MSSPTAAPPPEIYEATCATDGSEPVDRGKLLTRAEAEARRQAELDIVVCGPDEGANWQLAREIETAVSPAGQKPKAHARPQSDSTPDSSTGFGRWPTRRRSEGHAISPG